MGVKCGLNITEMFCHLRVSCFFCVCLCCIISHFYFCSPLFKRPFFILSEQLHFTLHFEAGVGVNRNVDRLG